MTICDIYHDKALLADWLGIPPEGQLYDDGRWYRASRPARTIETHDQFKERVARAWTDYTLATNPHKEQTWTQFIRECLKAFPGMSRKGSIAECRKRIIEVHPEMYTTNATASAA